MKINKFILAFAALATLITAISLNAATTVGVVGTTGQAGYIVNSSGGAANAFLATNGLYSAGLTNNTTQTNLVCLTPGGFQDSDMVIQLTAAATEATTSNVVFRITSSALPVTITNNAAVGNQSAQPRGTFATYTIALNGTTAVTTNIVLSHSSTPAVAKGLNLFLESISTTATNGYLTNYSVAVTP